MILIRINKYISDTGFCSRREADQLLLDERVTVNGILAVMGTKVTPDDKVKIDGQIIRSLVEYTEKKAKSEKKKATPKVRKPVIVNKKKETEEVVVPSKKTGTRGNARIHSGQVKRKTESKKDKSETEKIYQFKPRAKSAAKGKELVAPSKKTIHKKRG